ncbi:MAG: NAD-dependent epimerase/dehydratase family protein [Acidobacteria bacterium]|nr:NAD-dependent epimerase/dehydratase family protein [Acidobacteriota bacterium]
MVKALVTGATGFIGRRLLPWLKWPVVLTRDPERARTALTNVELHRWEPEAAPPPAEAFRGVDTVFHLAGESVAAGRWSAARKQRIRDSRVLGTRHLVAALASLK